MLGFQIGRNMEQRAGWRNLDTLGAEAPSGETDHLQSQIQIRPPDISAIHHAERHQQVVGRQRQSLRELARTANQVQMHARDR